MYILNNKYFLFSILLLSVYLSPLIHLGEDAYVLIHDNLDSTVGWYKTLVANHMLFLGNDEILTMFMNAPRASFGSEFDVILWLYYFFEPYSAYVINQVLIHSIAFIGMYLLLYHYVLKALKFQKYTILVALLFALLPFWPSGGLSVSGLPLITYVFLNIKNNVETKKDWMIVFLFPLYSSFVLSLMFYIFVLGLVWLLEFIRHKVTLKFTLALFLFVLMYVIINYRLFEMFLFSSDFISHRVERVNEYYGFVTAVIVSLKHFVLGQYHAHSLHIVFLPFVVVIFFFNIFSNNKDRLFMLLFILNLFISLWYGFWKYEGWELIKEKSTLLTSLNLSRVHFLTPLIWYTLFALSIKYYLLYIKMKYKHILLNSLFIMSVLLLFFKSDFIQEYRNNAISYKAFYSQSLFKQINTYIGKEKSSYRVVSIGIHPSIARHNGFYTLDGYLTTYNLDYKHQFRTIIKEELEKNRKLKKSFDNWGNRCYLFIDDIGYNFTRTKNEVYPIRVRLKTELLTEMGGKYIFSSYEIKNASENNLKLLNTFDDKNSAWRIYLYEII